MYNKLGVLVDTSLSPGDDLITVIHITVDPGLCSVM